MFKDHQKFLEEEQWGPSGGYIPAFKCRGWSNRGKNQTPKTSLGLPTKPKKIPFWISKPYNFQESIKLYNTKSKLEIKCLCFAAMICRHHHKSSHPKKELPNFRNLKKYPTIENVRTQKRPSPTPTTWNLEHPHPPPPPWEWGYLLQPHPLPTVQWRLRKWLQLLRKGETNTKLQAYFRGCLPIIITFSQDFTVQLSKGRDYKAWSRQMYTTLHSQSPSLAPLSPRRILFLLRWVSVNRDRSTVFQSPF